MTVNAVNNAPVIIGAGQYIHRPQKKGEGKSPFEMIQTAIRLAEEDSGVLNLSRKIDSLSLVNILSYQTSPENPASELSTLIDARPERQFYTWIGASAPQWFINRAAERLASGQSRLELICGGEAFYSRRFMAEERDGVKTARVTGSGYAQKAEWMAGDLRDPLTPMEIKYGLIQPIHIYPLFENALRYHEGLSIADHRKELGEFCSGLSGIAGKNPYAWFQNSKTNAEIMNETADNRMISFPYTKYMCSIMGVDQAAAVFMTDEKTAKQLGIPEEAWIYVLGSGDASDIWHVTERENFYSSPSVRVAAEMAMEQSGTALNDIDYFDFYSCFPCAPRITRNMLGIPKNDSRPLTITGGMPYFGGPGNNYALHAICKMVELLRQDPARIGLVQALSWFISKHSVGIYSGEKRKSNWINHHERFQAELDRLVLKGPVMVEQASGEATVETYTLFHDRQGQPVKAVIIGRLDDGSRFLSQPPPDAEILRVMMEDEAIGKRGKVEYKDDLNIFQVI